MINVSKYVHNENNSWAASPRFTCGKITVEKGAALHIWARRNPYDAWRTAPLRAYRSCKWGWRHAGAWLYKLPPDRRCSVRSEWQTKRKWLQNLQKLLQPPQNLLQPPQNLLQTPLRSCPSEAYLCARPRWVSPQKQVWPGPGHTCREKGSSVRSACFIPGSEDTDGQINALFIWKLWWNCSLDCFLNATWRFGLP